MQGEVYNKLFPLLFLLKLKENYHYYLWRNMFMVQHFFNFLPFCKKEKKKSVKFHSIESVLKNLGTDSWACPHMPRSLDNREKSLAVRCLTLNEF